MYRLQVGKGKLQLGQPARLPKALVGKKKKHNVASRHESSGEKLVKYQNKRINTRIKKMSDEEKAYVYTRIRIESRFIFEKLFNLPPCFPFHPSHLRIYDKREYNAYILSHLLFLAISLSPSLRVLFFRVHVTGQLIDHNS